MLYVPLCVTGYTNVRVGSSGLKRVVPYYLSGKTVFFASFSYCSIPFPGPANKGGFLSPLIFFAVLLHPHSMIHVNDLQPNDTRHTSISFLLLKQKGKEVDDDTRHYKAFIGAATLFLMIWYDGWGATPASGYENELTGERQRHRGEPLTHYRDQCNKIIRFT